jgi:hypothetical protein
VDNPALTIVLTGRNDNYGGDFAERFLRTLEFNVRELRAAAIGHEIVLVEWNPLPDRPLLSDLIRERLGSETGEALQTIVVDPGYHDALTLNPHLSMLEYVAKNVGIRRARGAFVLSTNTDILFGRGVVTALGTTLALRTVYRVPRIDLNIGTDVSNAHWETLEDERRHVRRPVLRPPLYSGGTGDFLLLDRLSFHQLRGFNEIYRVVRVGIDYSFLVKAHGTGLAIAPLDGCVYHVNHVGSFRLSKHSFRDRPAEAPWGDQRWPSHDVVYENPPAWGLGSAPEEPIGPNRVRLRFGWDAVPPMLDLKRVVLPARAVPNSAE